MADQTTPDEKRATYPEAERSFLSVEWERIAKSQRQTINRLEQERDQYAAVMEKVREHSQAVTNSGENIRKLWAIREALATAPTDALREVKADVWASGYNAGYSDRSSPGEPFTRNPYKAREERA